jgi:hypothetical protein
MQAFVEDEAEKENLKIERENQKKIRKIQITVSVSMQISNILSRDLDDFRNCGTKNLLNSRKLKARNLKIKSSKSSILKVILLTISSMSRQNA